MGVLYLCGEKAVRGLIYLATVQEVVIDRLGDEYDDSDDNNEAWW